MLPISFRRPAGFTLVETMVALVIAGFLLAVGIPSMSNWLLSNKAASANEFYMEGFRLARQQAISHNTASRLLLTANATNGQLDWQVDICFPTSSAPCVEGSENWSTPAAPAANDPEGANGFRSVLRSAANLPPVSVIAPTLLPDGAYYVFYTALGWVDTNYPARVTRLELAPAPAYAGRVRTSAIAVTLGGMPTRCDPSVAVTDSRACPP
ncbi:prepilin-type N-terminal cleavage/methylation domain-containing protein [Massilia sp. R2A-15]|uniref:pilus assembly FimT family protein n=1 Tax=Massilia sp. R2A-15 TaxID=3064278 RepID=UPI0027371C40|nr:prepilin-type N-terminal cleavage/methylation domain-containing protein [Massilia sp. R2A-15]WLI91494.1 prepilin-type N-terminal cleavage/methylation domain-containing protein [Massilia sp. R2A-15]